MNNQSLQQPYMPVDLTNLDIAFPATVRHLMPKWEDIPAEFQRMFGDNKWVRFFNDLFHHGIKITKLVPKDRIDPKKAMRHMSTIAGSFEPEHEHKVAACAYLASLWFEDVKYEALKK